MALARNEVRRALVTGGNRGIGAAIADGLAAKGVDVTIGVREPGAVDSPHKTMPLDLAEPEARHLPDTGFDILINNAGVLFDRPLLADPDGYRLSMSVMVDGPYDLIRQIGPAMAARGYGRIVNVSSGWGSFSEGLGGGGAYGMAKAALNGLTVLAARELPSAVKVNAMCPGWVHTRMGGQSAPRTPQEGADTALWLATLDDSGPTGGFFRDQKPINW
ncbi:SDR family NAD(P)-dependent oxidoreductase [Shimia ponticola]|uniref:SDR family NAD(P)-dependent oxidoreductase n=1 Tax=Shimia ponticola TaxID=2582893 RepID=UPI0011BF7F5C|nr:SDR family NAD(P)-dependent oxidoreductase [Shimia ponticola]